MLNHSLLLTYYALSVIYQNSNSFILALKEVGMNLVV